MGGKVSMNIIDIHMHPLFNFITEDDLLKASEEAGVDYGILLALDLDPQNLDRPEVRQMLLQRLTNLYVWDAEVVTKIRDFLQSVKTDNELVANLVRKHPKRFAGFGSINLAKSDMYVEEKMKEIDKFNLRGIKFIPTLQFFNPMKNMDKLRKVFEFCERKRKIVMFHTGCDPFVWEMPELSEDANPKYLKSIIQEFENVQVILAHMGCYSSRYPGIWFNEALELGKNHENVWFDIAAASYIVTEKEYVNKIREKIGVNRVLFGSDYPAVMGSDIKSTVEEVRETQHLTEKEKEKILGLNAKKLLHL